MSYHLGLYRFTDGEPAEPDRDAVRAVLSPVRAGQEKDDDGATEYWIRAADGSEAEIGVFAEFISVERPQVGDVWRIVIELADRLRAGVLLPDGTFLCPEEMRAHLPEGMESSSVFVPAVTLAAFEDAAGPFTEPLT
ncbi:hypothetical protein GCM10010348_19780 [Streptomyces anthocyanicus]|uniref:DUF4265 domain-containing protein n=1 Tax=Streptomyces rubrogriseus TaxID=194673 RepID=A0ABT4NWC8_9ACTN|nr:MULTISPECIES: hypothetical protein [Streptomyces anthocyanicus group]MCW8118998.1 hypothetical protein [Streptomyces anthocyanicus]MCZ4633440.1 hypothetical protein [Streptomyces rubrogriseus]GHB99551.1 hypothetical protein GCM10010348_19780 [Streptomyces anthocyanicus]